MRRMISQGWEYEGKKPKHWVLGPSKDDAGVTHDKRYVSGVVGVETCTDLVQENSKKKWKDQAYVSIAL